MKKFIFYLFLISVIFGIKTAEAQTQWRGTNRDGIYPEKHLLKEWPADGPKMLWSCEGLGTGQGSVVVADGKIFVTGIPDTLNSEGYLFAFDEAGKLL